MAFFIDDILPDATLNALCEVMEHDEAFEDGGKTASGAARRVKNNRQARPDLVQGARELLKQALAEHADFQAAALPSEIARIAFSRYEPGMAYGAHVDNAYIGGVRTDLSFTVFLSEPDSYDGGELIIRRFDGDEAVKLPKGSLYLYPSDSVHEVAPVTRGVRLAAVGWIRSKVRSDAQREVLFDVQRVLRELKKSSASSDAHLTLLRVRNSLLRFWGE